MVRRVWVFFPSWQIEAKQCYSLCISRLHSLPHTMSSMLVSIASYGCQPLFELKIWCFSCDSKEKTWFTSKGNCFYFSCSELWEAVTLKKWFICFYVWEYFPATNSYCAIYIYIYLQTLGAVIGSPRSEVIDGSESKRVLGTKQVLSTMTSSLLPRNSSFWNFLSIYW